MEYKCEYLSPLGTICLTSDGENLTGLWFDLSNDAHKHGEKFAIKDLSIFADTKKWLDIYFKGQMPDFTPKYKLQNLTPFRKCVLDIVSKIPYGKLITYNDIAIQIAKQKGIKKMSAQAVGGAVGWNPICLIVPCHRVIGANNNLTGYGGGILNKVELLKLEGHDINNFKMPKL